MKIISYILFFIIPFCGFSQTDTVAHLYAFGGLNHDNAEGIDTTSDGGYITVGATSSNSSGNTDIYLLKVDSDCTYQWSFALGGTNNDLGYAVKQTFDKGFIIAASSNSTSNGGYKAVLYKRDSLGNHIWTKYYGGQDWSFAYDVVQTYDSGFVFCGETYNNTNGFSDVHIVKTNNIGDTLWTRTIGGALIDKGNAIIETSDSNIVVAGIKNTLADSTQAYLIKLSANGTLLWDSIYGGVGYDVANAVIETNDLGFVIAGTNSEQVSNYDLDFWVLKTDVNGSEVWNSIFGDPGDEKAYDLIELANGKMFVVGSTEAHGAGGEDAKLFLVKPSGVWGGLGPTYGSVLDEGLKSISMNKSGGLCVAGYTSSYGIGNNDVLLIRLDTVVLDPDTTINVYEDAIPLVVKEFNKKSSVEIYPNPGHNYFMIKSLHKNIDKVKIIDMYGRAVKELKVSLNSKNDISDLKKGVYTLLFFEKWDLVNTSKLIKN